MKHILSLFGRTARALCFCLGLLGIFAPLAKAATITWNGASDATFGTAGNWVGGVAPKAADIALFNSVGTTFRPTVTLSVTGTVAGIQFGNTAFSGTQGYNIISGATGSPYLVLANSGTTGILSNFSGTGITQTLSLKLGVGVSHVFGNWTAVSASNVLVLAQTPYSNSSNTNLIFDGVGIVRVTVANFAYGDGADGVVFSVRGGILDLANSNVLSGRTHVNGGVLLISHTAAHTNRNIAFGEDGGAGGTLKINVPTVSVAYLLSGHNAGIIENATNAPATLTIAGNAASNIFSGVIRDGSAPLNLTMAGLNGSIQRLTGNSTYTGTTTLKSGFLEIGSAQALGNGGPIVFAGGGLSWNGVSVDVSSRFTTGPNQPYLLGVSGTVPIVFASPITSAGGTLTKDLAGTLVLTGANTYTGLTTILNGVLSVGTINSTGAARRDSSNLGAPTDATAGRILLGNGATLRYTGSGETTDRAIALNGNVTGIVEQNGTGLLKLINFLPSDSGYFRFSGTGLGEVAGVIPNAGNVTGLQKYGTGTWLLSGANTYRGQTFIREGTLIISSFNSITTNATLGTVHSGSSSLGAPTDANNGRIYLGYGEGAPLDARLIYTGPGETTDRIIRLSCGGSYQTATTTIANEGTGFLKILNMEAEGNSINTLILAGSGTGEIAGSIRNENWRRNLTKEGTGTWILSGVNDYAGTTRIMGGVLGISSRSNLGGPFQSVHQYESAIQFYNNSTFRVDGSFNLDHVLDFSYGNGTVEVTGNHTLNVNAVPNNNGLVYSILRGENTLTKEGTGTLTVSGPINDFGGNIAVNNGTLRVATEIAYSPVSVSARGTITSDPNASASVKGITVASDNWGGGTVSPGDKGKIGFFSIEGGGVTLGTADTAGRAHLAIDIAYGGIWADPGYAYDTLNINGGVLDIINADLDLNFIGGYIPEIGDKFSITYQATDKTIGMFANADNSDPDNPTITTPDGYQFAIFTEGYGYYNHDLTLVYMAYIPEPGTWGLLVCGLGTLVALRRRRA